MNSRSQRRYDQWIFRDNASFHAFDLEWEQYFEPPRSYHHLQQIDPYMGTTEEIVIVNFLKPFPIHLPTNKVCIYIVGALNSQGKRLKKLFTPWFHVMREGRLKAGGAQKRGAHGDGVELNIKVHPPYHNM